MLKAFMSFVVHFIKIFETDNKARTGRVTICYSLTS